MPRTQPLICVGCFVHYWVSCAINKGGFFEIAFVVVVDTHLPRFEALAYVLSHFDGLTHVVIRMSSAFIFQKFAEVSTQATEINTLDQITGKVIDVSRTAHSTEGLNV